MNANLSRCKRNRICKISFWIALFLVIVSSIIYSNFTDSYQTCRDGWHSPSIGKRGAGSHHGGIVTRVSDYRSEGLTYLHWLINVLGGICSAMFVYLLLTYDKEKYYLLEKSIESVPLRIGAVTKTVFVKQVSDNVYKTVEPVAVISDPTRKRTSIYSSEIDFVKVGNLNKFRQCLEVTVHTNRGNSYRARAFSWNNGTQ